MLQFFRRLHYLLNQSRFDRELQGDMEFHQEMAMRHGRSNFGNLLRLREDAREAWGWTWIDGLIQDLRFALRMGLRNPLYSAFVILILSIGIGGNTGMFAIVNSVLVRPLPYPGDNGLFVATETIPREQLTNDQVSYPLFLDWQSESRTLEALGAYFVTSDAVLLRSSAYHQQIAYASASLFSTLGVTPVVGRTFLRDRAQSTDAHTVVLSEEFWREHFYASRDVAGSTITVGTDVYTVIGVLPKRSSYVGPGVNLWLPIEPMASLPFMRNRDVCFLTVVSRLRRGATVSEAQAELGSIQKRDQISFPGVDAGHGVQLQTLRDFIVGPRSRSLLILGAAVFCLLLVVCANVGGLMMERSAARQGEFAMRRALGAPRSRIVRQVLTESLLLATLGGGIGLVASRLAISAFMQVGATLIPDANPVSYDLHVFWFSAAAILLTSIATGSGPAWTMWGSSKAERLKGLAGVGLCAGRRGLRRWLVTTEVALTVVLLCAASLLIVSFARLSNVNPGFRTDHLLVATISLPAARYDTQNGRIQFFDNLGQELEQLPGVAHVSAVSTLPISGGDARGFVTIENHPFPPDQQPSASFRRVLPNYFQMMGIPVLSGREFQASDQGMENGRPMIVLINEQMAKQLWPDRRPLGERIKIGPAENEPWLTIVGVVADVHNTRLEAQPDFSTYEPFAQRSRETMTIVVRTSLDPHNLEESVVSTIRRRESEAAIFDVMTMEERVASSELNWKFNAWITGAFAALALSLAVVGTYASLSYSVRQRTPEIGLRMALGAQPRRVLADVLTEAIEIAVTGLGIGTIAAFAVGYAIRSLLFGVTGADPAIYGAVVVAVVLTILLASLVPARHAAHIDPTRALRTQ